MKIICSTSVEKAGVTVAGLCNASVMLTWTWLGGEGRERTLTLFVLVPQLLFLFAPWSMVLVCRFSRFYAITCTYGQRRWKLESQIA